MALHHGSRPVDVDHQAGQRIPFAVDQAIAGGLRIVRQPQQTPHVPGRGDPPAPPLRIDGLVLEGQHPHGYRSDLVVAAGDEVALLGVDIHQIALPGLLVGLDILHGSRKDPGVTAQKRLLLTSSQINFGSCHV